MAAKDLGVKHIRGHGLLDDDMSVSFRAGVNSFYNVDSIVDFLDSVNMRPIFELSFLPAWLASGSSTICKYQGRNDPPSNYTLWGELIGQLGQHLVDKYGEDMAAEFYFEVWNEPNDGFFTGTEEDYFHLYQEAALNLKLVSPKLRVGGPATNSPARWITDFVSFCNDNDVPFDFISTHGYSACSMNGLGDVDSLAGNIAAARHELEAARAPSAAPNLSPAERAAPWILTEYGDSCNQGFGLEGDAFFPSAIHDMIDQASYTIKAVAEIGNDFNRDPNYQEPYGLSYWAISDVFEEKFFPVSNESFHGAFGLINLHGVPKPTYRAYQLLHETGDVRLPVNPLQPPPVINDTCGEMLESTDFKGGDISRVNGVNDIDQCCYLCALNRAHDGGSCNAVSWMVKENTCILKDTSQGISVVANPDRVSAKVDSNPLVDDELCAKNTNILPVYNSVTKRLDLFYYNHASYADPINDCQVTAVLPADIDPAKLAQATVQRIDEQHSNPLATWVEMGAPDYTNSSQNDAIRASSELKSESLPAGAVTGTSILLTIPTHGIAVVSIQL